MIAASLVAAPSRKGEVQPDVWVPEQMGRPKDDQLQGYRFEVLAELAGRVCYDSLGKGRGSDEYHRHILEVRHLSVYEHCVFTIEVRSRSTLLQTNVRDLFLPALMNRPGVFVGGTRAAMRVTLNLRAVLEWDGWIVPYDAKAHAHFLHHHLRNVAHQQIAGHVVAPMDGPEPHLLHDFEFRAVHPETDDELWVSLFLSGSRGFSHEQVRHGDFTAISQRSTRYVDEAETPWVEHPLIAEFKVATDSIHVGLLAGLSREAVHAARWLYAQSVESLHGWLVEKGVDKGTARKQARGAARGFLGNALYTEMIFSASVRQWRRMLQQRCSPHADAEIRVLYGEHILPELKRALPSRFPETTVPCPTDGIGVVLGP